MKANATSTLPEAGFSFAGCFHGSDRASDGFNEGAFFEIRGEV
jgi:hypothetical protein